MGSMLIRSAKCGLPEFVLLSFGSFKTVQNRRSTTIREQCCVCLSISSCGREELNECLTDQYVQSVPVSLRPSRADTTFYIKYYNFSTTGPNLFISSSN